MSRSTRIAIVGGGQAGLQLAHGLVADGVDVTLITDRDGDALRGGRVLSTQCMFDSSLALERELGLDLWPQETPRIRGIRYSVGEPDGGLALQFGGRLAAPAQSVDQRRKMAAWLELLEQRGGRVLIESLEPEDLDGLAEEHDLVVLAAGKRGFGELLDRVFPRDPARSPYDRPQRNLAVAYLRGYAPLDTSYFSINIVPGVGECFVGPALTVDGPCFTICFEALFGGPMDRFGDVPLDDEARWLETSRGLLERFMPWEAERWTDDVRLTDAGGTLRGALTPAVRHAAGRLPSGRPILGLGDLVVQNDPLVGQGSNSAAKAADVVRRAIAERGDGPLDHAWVGAVADRCWRVAEHPTAFTNLLLNPPPHLGALFDAASASPAFADRLAAGSNDPATLFPWINSAEGIREAAAETEAQAGAVR